MAQLALGAAGAAVGFWVGGPVGASIGWSIGAAAGGALFPPKGPHSEGPRITDLRTQISTYGAPIPIVYGRDAPAGCVIWAGETIERKTETEIGGKGGPQATQTEYSYFSSFAISICEGEMDSLTRIWVNGKCFYDVRDEANADAMVASLNFQQFFTWYPGSETQEPDPTMEATLGVGNVPGYRGRCYIVFNECPLALFGNYPVGALQWQFEVTRVGTVTEGLRILETGTLLGRIVYPLSENGGVIRSQEDADETYVTSFEGDSLASEESTEDESQWPDLSLPAAADFTYMVMRAWDGSVVRISEPSTVVSNPLFRFYTEVGGEDGPQMIGTDLLDQTDRVMSSIPCADLRHFLVLTGSGGSATIDKWRLFEWDGNGFSLVSTGSATSAPHFIPGMASHDRNYAGMLESDLTYIWSINALSSPALSLHWINPDTNTLESVDDIVEVSPTFAASYCAIWADDGLAWATFAGQYYRLYTRLPGAGDNTEDLADVVENLCNRCGLDSAELDVSDLVGTTVDGYAVSGVTAGRAAIQHLQRAYWFDSAEIDGQLVFVDRGGAAVVDIPADDLGAGDEVGTELVGSERQDDDQMPTLLNVAYKVAAADYQPGVQTAQRETIPFEQPTNVELPIVLTDLAAKQVADVLLYDAWMSRNRRRFSTNREYSYLTPTDVVTVTDDFATYTVRIEKISAANGVLQFDAVDEDAAIYDPNSEAAAIVPSNPLTVVAATRTVLLDIPILLTPDDGPGFYAAAAGYAAGWPGAKLYMSPDNGGSWSPIASFDQAAVIGTMQNTLGDWPGGNFIDSINLIEVTLLPGGTLESVTVDELLSGSNVCAIGSEANGWEIVQFADASLVTGTTWELSRLLRGRLGTEAKMATHGSTETFVLLQQGKVKRIAAELSSVNSPRLYKGVTLGQLLTFATTKTFTNTAVGLEPYSPVNAAAGGFGGDITITWDRRGRLDNGWLDNIDVPLSEATEAYEIDIYEDDTFTTVVRTLESTTDSVVYEMADQATDFGSPLPSEISIAIYQLSASVGRGFPCFATLS